MRLSLPALPVAAGWAPGSSVEVSAVTASLTNMSSIGLFNQRRAQAIALRRAGRSRRDIKEILGITSNATLDRALRGEPPPAWTLRPRATGLRARARDLRAQGLDYDDIAAARGVSKSSVSLWVRDMPRPERLSYEGGSATRNAGSGQPRAHGCTGRPSDLPGKPGGRRSATRRLPRSAR